MKPPENHQNHHLNNCLHPLSSLAHSIPTLRSFFARWTAIAATLSRLRSFLDELSSLPSNDLSSHLLLSLSQTLTLTVSLSNQCRFADPPAGRLQTQSDLATAASSLSQLAADAEFLLRSGSLLHPPNTNKSLITRLHIGTLESRIPALDSIISSDKKVVNAAKEGLVPALVRLLDCASISHPEAREKAVAAIAKVASFESCRHLVVAEAAAASLITHLSRVLAEPNGFGSTKEKACAALQAMTLDKDAAFTVASGGTIEILLEICRSGTPSAQAAAAGVLRNLTVLPEIRTKLIEENIVPVLIRVFQSGTVVARQNSAFCLSNLTSGEDKENQGLKLELFQQGVLDCIRNYWECPSVDNRDLQPAIKLLRNLSSSIVLSEIVLSSGFLPRITLALDSSSAATRTEAVRAVSELALVCANGEGFEYAMPKIVGMLEAKGEEEKKAAAKALASLMMFSICRRLMRKDEKGILKLFVLLDSSVCDVEKKDVVAVLLAVARSRRCRKLMVGSGARGLLPWLESMEVEGAKKLSELLSKGKLLGVFPRN